MASNPISVEQLQLVADDLRQAAQAIVAIIEKMKEAGLPTALFPWTKSTWNALQDVSDLPGKCETVLKGQIIAKKANVPSKIAQSVAKGQKDTERRRKQRAEAGIAPKPPGRPPKSIASNSGQ